MFTFLEQLKARQIAIFLGLVYFIIGLVVFGHYGISYDEEVQRINNGRYNYEYVTGENKQALREGNEKYHGAAFELLLIALEDISGFHDLRHVYLMRHLVNFLFFFASVVCIYLLAIIIFGSEKWALFCGLLYSLSPRFFAEAFYNSKDIIFLAFLVFSIYTMIKLLQKMNIKWLIIHSLVTGFLIDVRILGIMMPMVTLGFVIYENYLLKISAFKPSRIIPILGAYIVLQFLAIMAFWPILWDGPFHHLKAAFVEMSHYHWTGYMKYWGQLYSESQLPWHYLPVWMGITIPTAFLSLVVLGTVIAGVKLLSFNKTTYKKYRFDFMALAIFLGPLLLIIIMKSIVYDGWRHVYFLYAPMVLLGTRAMIWIWKNIKARVQKQNNQKVILVALSALVFSMPLFDIIRYHPYQFAYFNLVGNMFFTPLEKNFEKDYWGLSYKQGLEYLIETAPEEGRIKLMVENSPGYDNRLIIPKKERRRFRYMNNFYENGIYYLSDKRARFEPKKKFDGEIVHQIKTPSGVILDIYKTTASKADRYEIYTKTMDFENSDEFFSYSKAFSGEYVDKLDSADGYGFNTQYTVDSLLLVGHPMIEIDARIRCEKSSPNINYVVVINREGLEEAVLWRGESLGFVVEEPNEWYRWEGSIDIGDIELKKGDNILIYLWNIDGLLMYQDDVKISILSYVESE